MKLPALFLLFLFGLSSLLAQSTFSITIPNLNSTTNITYEVKPWGKDYLVKGEYFGLQPTRIRQNLHLIDSTGRILWSEEFRNPGTANAGAEWTELDYVVQTDSAATQISYCVSRCDFDDNARITRFNKGGELVRSGVPGSGSFAKRSDLFAVGGEDVLFVTSDTRIGSGERVIDVGRLQPLFASGDFYSYANDSVNLEFQSAYLGDEGFFIAYAETDTANRTVSIKLQSGSISGTVDWRIDLPPVSSVLSRGYIDIQPLPGGGIAVLEGIGQDDILCAGSCPPTGTVFGTLHIYSDRREAPVTQELRFLARGLDLTADGDLLVYGSTYKRNEDRISQGVLYKPAGWPSGSPVHLIPPYLTEAVPESFVGTDIMALTVADNGYLVGTGRIITENIVDVGYSSPWLFRLNPSGCFTDDCSEVVAVGDLDGLVPTSQASRLVPLQVYPNPTTNQLTVEGVADNVAFQLFNITGQLVKNDRLQGAQLDMRDLTPGIYILSVVDGERLRNVRVVLE